jgi:hypothetical protein
MAPIYLRGGLPVHVNGSTAITAVKRWSWDGGYANQLWFQNTGTGPIVLSFTQADADNDIGVAVASGADVLLPTEIDSFYTKSAADQTFQAVAFRRRG